MTDLTSMRLAGATFGMNLRPRAWSLGMVGWLAALAMTLTLALRAAEFPLGGTTVSLIDVTDQTEVTYRSLRLNPVLGVWNAELTVRNRGTQPLPTPLVVMAESWTGTSGPQATDHPGVAGGVGPFWNLTPGVTGGALAPGGVTVGRLITLGAVAGSAPRWVPRVFARVEGPASGTVYGFARALDTHGLPVRGVVVTQEGPSGARSRTVDPDSGVITLGGLPGEHRWRFDGLATGHLPVWLHQTLLASVPQTALPRVQSLVAPRMTPRSKAVVRLAAGPGSVATGDGTITLRFPANSIAGATDITLTPLDDQALPLALPGGWSPRAGCWWEASASVLQSITAEVSPRIPVPAGTRAVWVRLDEGSVDWRVVQTVTLPAAGPAEVTCPGPGAYALLVADPAPGAPPVPVTGQVLAGVALPVPNEANWVAEGRVTPPVTVASTNGVLVTALAEVTVRSSGPPIPSGTQLRCEISETYRLTDGRVRTTPRQETFLTLYRDLQSAVAHAEFPLRPTLLLGGEQLAEARVEVQVLVPEEFVGAVLLPGGSVTLGGLILRAPDGALVSPEAVRVRSRSVEPGTRLQFELEVSGVTPGRSLAFSFQPPLADGEYVLSRSLAVGGEFGPEPVARFAVPQGVVSTHETGPGLTLPGLARSGAYAVHPVAAQLGVVSGIVRGSGAAVAPGLSVRVDGQPWLVLTDDRGTFRTLGAAGLVAVTAQDPASQAGVRREFTLPPSLESGALELVLDQVPPRVAAVTPGADAVGVPLLSPVVVTFTQPVQTPVPAVDPIILRTTSGSRVPARVRFDAGSTAVRLYPSNQLEELTRYTVEVAPGLLNGAGQALAGPRTFAFTTLTNVPIQKVGSELYSEAPGADGLARVIGTAGFAQPRQPVLFVNDTTGQTATLDAGADGGFANSIPATVDDRLRIVLVNTDGSRTEVPVGRQVFPDGSVALYSTGGSFRVVGTNSELREATVTLPPGATTGRTKLKLELRSLSELASVSRNTPPTDGAPVGLFRLTVEGDPLRVPASLRFQFDPAELESRFNATPGTNEPILVAAVPRSVAQAAEVGTVDVLAYDYLGSLTPVGGSVSAGLRNTARPQSIIADWVLQAGGSGALDVLLFGVRLWAKFEITGLTVSAELSGGVTIVAGTEVPLAGAVVRGRTLANENQRPFSLQPGELFTTSDGDGVFNFLAPTHYTPGFPPQLIGYSLVGTHPSFPRIFAANSTPNLINPAHPFGVGKLAFDRKRPPDTTPPSISLSHEPPTPDPGQPVRVRIETVGADGPPRLVIESRDPLAAVARLTRIQDGLWELECDRPAKVVLKAEATDAVLNRAERFHAVTYGLPVPRGPLADDRFGPFVVYSQPDERSVGVPAAAALTLLFSEALDAGNPAPTNQLLSLPGNYLTLQPPAGQPRVAFGRDRREVLLSFPSMRPDTAYSLVIQNILDAKGQLFDQDPDPATPAAQPYVLGFRTAPLVQADLAGVSEGGGAVLRGALAYVLDRRGETLNAYDVSVPAAPRLLQPKRSLPGPARTLALIPDYSYAVDFASPNQPGSQPPSLDQILRTDLVAVAGKLPGGGYLRVHRLPRAAEPGPPIGEAVAGTVFNLDETALITRLVWSPPYLVAVENSATAPSLRVLNLQGAILGGAYAKLPPAQLATLPSLSTTGRDANGDGDFVDAGDELPTVGRDAVDFSAGETDLLTLAPNILLNDRDQVILAGTSRFITDAVVDGGSGFVGAFVTAGTDIRVKLVDGRPTETNRVEVKASFRGLVIGQDLNETNTLSFPEWYPKRALLVNVGTNRLALLTLLSLDTRTNRLVVVDCSRPGAVRLVHEIGFPQSEFGQLQGAELDGNGRVALSTVRLPSGEENLVLLDVRRLLDPPVPGRLHPSILGAVPGAGGGVAPFATRQSGLNVVSLGQRSRVTQTSPLLRLVPVDDAWTDPFGAVDLSGRVEEIRALPDLELLPVAFHGTNSTLIPGEASAHFRVLAELPGGAGSIIHLAALSLDAQGRLVSRPPNTLPSALVADLQLRRLSDDPSREAFNVYLSRPLAVVAQDLTSADAGRAQSAHPRDLMYAGARFRVGIPESVAIAGNPVLRSFAGVGDVTRAGDTNRPLVQLGVSLSRPVVNRQPLLVADDRLRLRTTVDWVNTNTCPGHVWLNFEVNLDCQISLTLDGRPVQNVLDESGRLLAVTTDIPFEAGPHRLLLDTTHGGQPGDHPYEVVAKAFEGLPVGIERREAGVLEHEVEIQHAFPIGHSIIQGVDLWDGHLALSRQDAQFPGRRMDLEFSRSYSSAGNSTVGPLGPGWTHNHHIRLSTDTCGRWTVLGGDGSGNAFTQPRVNVALAALYARHLPALSAGGRWEFFRPQIGYHSVLVRDTGKPAEAWFFTKTANRYHFVAEGTLSTPDHTVFTLREIREPNGNRLAYAYLDSDPDPTTLDTVTELDAQGALPKRGFRLDYQDINGEPRVTELRGFNRQGSADLLGFRLSFGYDADGNLASCARRDGTGAVLRRETYGYTAGATGPFAHNLTSVTDPNGNVTRYGYFGRGVAGYYAAGMPLEDIASHEVVETVTRVGTAQGEFAGTDDAVTRFQYGWATQIRRVSDPRGQDGLGQPIPDTVYTLNLWGATTRIEAPLGQVTEMRWATDSLDGSVTDGAGTPVRDVQMTWRRDAEGKEEFHEFKDGRGNETRERVVPAPGKAALRDSAGQVVTEWVSTTAYDALYAVATNHVDAEGQVTVTVLDPANGNALTVTDAEGQAVTYAYAANGDLQQLVNPRGYRTQFSQFDPYGNAGLVRTEVERGATPRFVETRKRFNERSRLEEVQNSFRHHATTQYDGLDRPFRSARLNDLAGGIGGPDAVEQSRYHPNGELRDSVNALGLVTRLAYDALSRRIRSEQQGVRQLGADPTNYVSTFAFDRVGNLVAETSPRGVTRTYAHDALNRRVRIEIAGTFGPNLVVSRTDYDRVGNETNTVDLHGFATGQERDGMHRVVATHLPVSNAVQRIRLDLMGTRRAETDANGNETVHEYDRVYRLTKTTDAEGNVTRFTYDAAGNRETERRESPGLLTTWVYDGLNRVVSQTQQGPGLTAVGYVTRTEYRDALNERVTVNPRQFATRVRQDGLDRVIEQVVDDGGLSLTTHSTYDSAGNVLTVMDPQGGDVDFAYEYDQLGRRLMTRFAAIPEDVGPVLELSAFDGVGNVVARVDRRGFERRMSYDNLNRPRTNLLREDVVNGGALLALTTLEYDDAANAVTTRDARGNASRSEQDPLGRPARMIDALGQVIRHTYDGMNRLTSIDRRGLQDVFTYDRLNRLLTTRELDTNGVERTRTRNVYRDLERLQLAIDRRGLTNGVRLDALGRVVVTERSGGDMAVRYGADPLQLESREYDGNGNLVELTDARGNRVRYEWDGADRRVSMTEGQGSPVAGTTRWKLDAVGNVLEVKDPRVHGALFDVQNTYDERYRRISTANALGQIEKFRYDNADNVVERTDPLGGVTRYEYDELNALLVVDETLRDSGTGDAGRTRFVYDENRNALAQQDANGNLVTHGYDALNRRTNTLQHTSATAGIINPRSHRPVPPAGTTLEWVTNYDLNGNQSRVRDARGQEVRFDYDHLDRLVRRQYLNHAEKDGLGVLIDFQVLELAATYDGNGNLLEQVERKRLGAGEVTERTVSVFDALDRVAVKTRFDHDDPAGRRLRFDYDRVGNRIRVEDPDLRITEYTFDERNRLATATLDPLAGPLAARYTWAPDSLLLRLDLPGGTFAERRHDPADRLLVISNAGPAGVVHSIYSYSYDANGNRSNQVETQPVLAAVSETTTYAYDRQNRLTNVVYGAAGTLSFTYAPNGNRLTESGTDPVSGTSINRRWHYTQLAGRPAATYSGVNTLTRIEDLTPAAAHIEYEYDANLNQVARVQGGVTHRFRFDIRDQMIAAQASGIFTRFDYNYDRLRAKKLASSEGAGAVPETRYLYDQNAVLIEYGELSRGHATQHKYDYGQQLLALGTVPVGGGGLDRDFYLHDGLGSTANLVTPTGALTHSYMYDAWGRMRSQAGTSANARQYTGHYKDTETGLHYFGARYYDDEQARFLSQDPYLGEAGTPPSLHRYLYAYDNPLKYVDLAGYESEEVGLLEQAGVQATGGLFMAVRRGVGSVLSPGGSAGWAHEDAALQAAASRGDWGRAVGIGVGVQSALDAWEVRRETGTEADDAVALGIGDFIGVNALGEAITGEALPRMDLITQAVEGNRTLSGLERFSRGIEGSMKAVTTVATVAAGVSWVGGNFRGMPTPPEPIAPLRTPLPRGQAIVGTPEQRAAVAEVQKFLQAGGAKPVQGPIRIQAANYEVTKVAPAPAPAMAETTQIQPIGRFQSVESGPRSALEELMFHESRGRGNEFAGAKLEGVPFRRFSEGKRTGVNDKEILQPLERTAGTRIVQRADGKRVVKVIKSGQKTTPTYADLAEHIHTHPAGGEASFSPKDKRMAGHIKRVAPNARIAVVGESQTRAGTAKKVAKD